MSEEVFRLKDLRQWAAKNLNLPEGEKLKTLSVLSQKEVYVLNLMITAAELIKEMEPDSPHAEMLELIVKNHLLLKISQDGAGRKDLKETVNPYRIYPLYHLEPPQPIQEAMEHQQEKRKRFRLF